jgi:type I restriction enzyme S subunit
MERKPAIRFEGYTDEWEQRKFGEVYQVNNERNEGQYPVEKTLSIASMTFNSQGNGAEEASLAKYKVLRIGDIAFEGHASKEFRYGRFVLNNLENGIMSPRFTTLRPIVEQDYNFWEYYIHSETVMRSHLVNATKAGTMMNELVPDDLFSQSILMPTLDEQKQIGALLKQIDNLITLHQSNYDKMVATKKSMIDKLFPQGDAKVPEIRFEGFVGDWEKKPLGAIVIPYSDPVEVPHDGYERLGIRSHGKGVFHEYVEAGKEITTAQLHRVAAHNFIVNITFAWEHAVAVTCDSDAGKLVSHRFPQFSMADGVYDQFLKYLILDARFRHHLLLSSPGGAGRNRVLKIPEMMEYEMMIPDIEEQKQIAGYLNSLDELIELYQMRIEKLKNIKAACLQGMFV